MALSSYKVTDFEGQWHVDFAGVSYGPFRNKSEAIAAAKGWAAKNVPSVVIAQDVTDKFNTVWTSDDPPLPLIR